MSGDKDADKEAAACFLCADDQHTRLLHCHHVLCVTCLRPLASEHTVTCPQCEKRTVLLPGVPLALLPRPPHTTLVRSWRSKQEISAVCVDEASRLIYAGCNRRGNPVTVYTLAGRKVRRLSDPGLCPGVVIDSLRGQVVLSVSERIRLYNGNGKLHRTHRPEGVGHINDVAYLIREDRYVVADIEDHCLHLVEPISGEVSKTVPAEEARWTRDNGRNIFIAASKTQHVSLLATLDYERCRVRLYTGEGEFVREYGETGGLWGPTGICFDPQGRIVISDMNNHRIVRINANLTEAEQEWEVLVDTTKLGLGHPRMLDVTTDGHLVVTLFTDVKAGPFHIAVFNNYQ